MIATELASANDRTAAETALSILAAIKSPEPEWWQTILGRACVRALGSTDAEAVSYSVAARMLGVHLGTVAQLAHRGTLDRHPDGGLTRGSVMQRIARLADLG